MKFIWLLCIFTSLLPSECASNINTSWEAELSDSCPSSDYIYFDMSCYKLNTTPLPRAAASATCREDKAHLVDITSQSEQDFVADLLENNDEIQRLRETKQQRDVGAWIGLMVSEISGELEWTDGRSLGFAAWDPWFGRNEPQVDCVRMDSRYHFQWSDRNCPDSFSFVCEKSSEIKMSSTTVMPRVATDQKSSFAATDTTRALNINASTGYHNYHDEITAIEIGYPILTVIVAVTVGVMVYCFYLRKKLRNHRCSVAQQPPSNTRHTVVGRREEPDEVRTSYQSNNYLEFKSDSQQNPPPTLQNHFLSRGQSHDQSMNRDSCNIIIKHTYFDPMGVRENNESANHVYTYIGGDSCRQDQSSESKYASVL